MITNIKEAVPIVKEYIEKANKNDKVINISPKNDYRHYLIKTEMGLTYWLLFKRSFFMAFGKIFGYRGIGESINKEWVDEAISSGIDEFVFVYENGYIYAISPQTFKNFAEKNNTIRETNNGETTYSIPISLLERWKLEAKK